MSNNIDLKQGLNIPISGAAVQKTRKTVSPDVIAVKPTDFKGLSPRLLVKEGDRVLAGSPVLADKKNPDILVTSPVSGTVSEVVRGEKRKLLEVKIKADGQQEYVDFGSHKVSEMTADDVKELLLKSGLWAGLVQRPYGIVADPSAEPKAIFVSAFSTAPLAARGSDWNRHRQHLGKGHDHRTSRLRRQKGRLRGLGHSSHIQNLNNPIMMTDFNE